VNLEHPLVAFFFGSVSFMVLFLIFIMFVHYSAFERERKSSEKQLPVCQSIRRLVPWS